MYVLVVWLVHGKLSPEGTFSWQLAISTTASDLVDRPLVVVTTILLILGLIFFTDSNSKWQQWLGGTLHALAHLTAIFVIGWEGYRIAKYVGPDWAWVLVALPFTFVLGWLVGSIIMGLYLLISLQVFGRHSNEAFSSIKINDYKNFLRLHLTEEGIEIFPIKIKHVSKWQIEKDSSGKKDYGKTDGSEPKMIEPPFLVPR